MLVAGSFLYFSPYAIQATEKILDQQEKEVLKDEETTIDVVEEKGKQQEDSTAELTDPVEEAQKDKIEPNNLEEDTTNDSQNIDEANNQINEGVKSTEAKKKKPMTIQPSAEKTIVLEFGVRDHKVIQLKEKLNHIGFGGILVTEYYGAFTKQRVEEFQANYGLEVSGVANEATLAKLDEVTASPFQKGKRNEQIPAFKEKLNLMGFGGISVTNYYGSFTEKRVKEFQRFVGIEPNGIADALTRSKLDSFMQEGFQKGDRHHVIPELKRKLNDLGFGEITVTTYYGSYTVKQVKKFQSYHGLKVTGKLNAKTISTLNSVEEKGLKKGDRHKDVIDLKKKLNRIGFGNILVTEYYGSFMETQVTRFQKYYGLVDNGIVDATTLEKINKVANSPFQKGKRHEKIPNLKKKLNTLGFGHIKVTNYFGSFSEKQVKAFQDYYGLRVNGIIDEVTLEKINDLIENGFQIGQRHPGIIDLKKDLNQLGFGKISVTTLFGSFTEKRVKDFQEYYGLTITGKADQSTLQKIKEIKSTPLQEGKRSDQLPAIKHKLNWLDYGYITVTNNFGTFMESRVKKFQKDYDLPVSGMLEENTLAKLNKVFEQTFQEGSRHSSVIDMKKKLNHIGFGGIKVTNYYGTFTKKRIQQFQNYYGIKATGKANYETLMKLDEVWNTPFQQGKHHEDTIQLKKNLNRLGFGHITLSTLYGSFTERQVKEFQDYHGLRVTGIADEKTLGKIDELLSSPFRIGQRHEDTLKLKEKLNRVGFGQIKVTTLYGNFTEQKVEEFQDFYSLRVSGIVDEPTMSKLNEIFNSPLQFGKRHSNTIELKKNLNKLGYDGITVTTYFGKFTEKRLKEFQSDYGLPVSGIADEITLQLLEEVAKLVADETNYSKYNLSLDQAVDMQMKLTVPPQTDQNYAYVSAAYINDDNQVTADVLNVRSGPSVANREVGTLAKGTVVAILGETNGWYQIEFRSGQWVNASRDDVRYFLNPNNFINDEKQKFQFLDLSRTSNATVSLINSYLNGKGILEGQGQAFIDASDTHGVSDVYLLSHALLETGNGTSALANGVKVGKNSAGKLELVTPSNKDRLHNIKTAYNMFGIGAVDGNAHEGGAFRAYQEGWFTPREAIVGGASFIGNSYIKAGQNTLYKMRWNPKSMDELGYPSHQYATDVGWASKQIYTMYNLYQELGIRNIFLDVPEYRN